jgi:hypothetical protein
VGVIDSDGNKQAEGNHKDSEEFVFLLEECHRTVCNCRVDELEAIRLLSL